MHDALALLIESIRLGQVPDSKALDRTLRSFNKRDHDADRRISKRRLLSFYMNERRANSDYYQSLEITSTEHDLLLELLRAKPRRTASGVATVSVLTMPWPCKGDCIYCPNDVRMPKSYMHDEPACQRAERCYFDPYLQVAQRLFVLEDMGHNIDKVELIVLGGTFSDYPESYRVWFTKEMFRALNEARTPKAKGSIEVRLKVYETAFAGEDLNALEDETARIQAEIDAGLATYNDSLSRIYADRLWKVVHDLELKSTESLESLQKENETAGSRNVGLVFETRPECIDVEHLKHLRSLGATKIQIGIQSLDDDVLDGCERPSNIADVETAMAELRKAGFKSHVHYMANLPYSNPEQDAEIWDKLVNDTRFLPDEVKVYPCALVESAHMMRLYESASWEPYTDRELTEVLLHCLETAPPYMRISRMIRDICSQDIVAGNKHTNLRQMIESEAVNRGLRIDEMRYREIGTNDVSESEFAMSDYEYETSNTTEHFLQWTDSNNKLAGFCRLSIPNEGDHAMIRELHVYGKSMAIGNAGEDLGAQHKGLGRRLIDASIEIATNNGKGTLKVISAIGTREYYRSVGFVDDGLYQSMELM